MAAACRDDVEQIAMISTRGIGPFARRTAVAARRKPDIKAAPGRVTDIADHPIMALTASA